MGDIGQAFYLIGLAVVVGIVLFLIVGLPLLHKIGGRAGGLFNPSDSNFNLKPEYSRAEARVKSGRYAEAVAEYRQVIERFPGDVFAHVRLAELAIEHLHDRSMAEAELVAALGKASSEEAMVLVSHRLADFYQNVCGEPQRAVSVLEALKPRLTSAKQLQLTDERLAVVRRFADGESIAPTPQKISLSKSRYRMDENPRV